MSRWRELARRMREQEVVRDVRDNRDDSPSPSNFVPIVPIVPKPVSLTRPEKVPDDPAAWTAALGHIDLSRSPTSFDPDRWRYLLADARWLCCNHGPAAAALGWNASDLFGIGPAPGWGGLADRLEGARNLVLTDHVAHWRSAHLEGWLWRTTMRPMTLPWEIDR